MTLTQVLPEVNRLSRADKLRLIQYLAADVACSEEGDTASVPDVGTIWSPHDAFAAAATLLDVLEQEQPVSR